MKTKIPFSVFVLGIILLLATGCGGSNAPSAGQANPTSAPVASNPQPTAVPQVNEQITLAPGTTLAPTQQVTSAPQVTLAAATEVGTAAPTEASTEAPTQTTAPTEAPTTAAPTNAPTANAPTGGSAAADIIADAQRAALSVKSYRSTTVTKTADGKTGTSVAEYVAPDRVHEIVNTTGTVVLEIIVIKGQGTWQKVNGKWTKSPVDMSETVFKFLDPKTFEEIRKSINIGTVQFAGPDVLNGTPMLVYTYTTELAGGANTPSIKGSYKIWIGALDHRAYKIEGDTDSLTIKGGKTHTVTTLEYDIPITIQPPS